MKRITLQLLLAFLLSLALPASAQQVIKIATIAPEGSSWMRELRTAAAEVQAGAQGRVQVKFYPGGVMGSDSVVLRKMRLGQLQGGVLTSSELATQSTRWLRNTASAPPEWSRSRCETTSACNRSMPRALRYGTITREPASDSRPSCGPLS